jgi:glycosyltransferase involved in cell wall biosynthesis
MHHTAQISVVVLTFNEELNLAACLESVAGWVSEIFVVDSGSTDGTLAIAGRFGAKVVAHPFETHARQWEWALAHLPLGSEWVLALDADQRVTFALRDELLGLFASSPSGGPNGYFLNRRQIFRGKWIRHGGYYPKYLLKLFRREHVSVDTGDLVDHHFSVRGVTTLLHGDLVEDNQNEAAIEVWTAKHNKYAVLQAQQELRAMTADTPVGLASVFGSPDARVRWLKQIWARLPLFVRPCLYFVYRYFLRLGFLDGREGFIFHVLQGFWYRLLVDINIAEMRSKAVEVAAPAGDRAIGAAEHEAHANELKPV